MLISKSAHILSFKPSISTHNHSLYMSNSTCVKKKPLPNFTSFLAFGPCILHAQKGDSSDCSQQTPVIFSNMVKYLCFLLNKSLITSRQEAKEQDRAMSRSSDLLPIVSKIFCSPSLTTLMVRKRPHVVNGCGFVVTDCTPKTIFSVDGCGVIGAKGELIIQMKMGLRYSDFRRR